MFWFSTLPTWGFFSVISWKQFRSMWVYHISIPRNLILILISARKVFCVVFFFSHALPIPSVVSHLHMFSHTSSSYSYSNKISSVPGVFHLSDQKVAFPPVSPTHFTSPTLSLALKWDLVKIKCENASIGIKFDTKIINVIFLLIFTISALYNKALTWDSLAPCCGSGRCRPI